MLAQRLEHLAAGLEAIVRALGQGFVEEVLVGGQFVGQRGNVFGQVLDRGADRRIRIVGQLLGRHLVPQHAQAVEVGAPVHGNTLGLFGAHIAGRTHHESGLGHLGAGVGGLGDAEVGKDEVGLAAQHDIAGLDIAVHVTVPGGIVQGVGHLLHQLVDEALGHRPANPARHVAAGQVLHGDVVHAVKTVDVINLQDVRVGKACRDTRLADEALGEVLVRAHRGVHYLDRDFPVEIQVQRTVHSGHTTASQSFVYLVTGYLEIGHALVVLTSSLIWATL